MILRYSATHRQEHNKVYRLDALDAYNQKLVKKIAVRGITVKGLAGTNAYLYLEAIEVSPASRRRPVWKWRSGGPAGSSASCGCSAATITCTTRREDWNSTKGSSSPTSTPSTTPSVSPTA